MSKKKLSINPLNAELNPICHLRALLGAHHILHISRIRVNVPLLLATLVGKFTLLELSYKFSLMLQVFACLSFL